MGTSFSDSSVLETSTSNVDDSTLPSGVSKKKKKKKTKKKKKKKKKNTTEEKEKVGLLTERFTRRQVHEFCGF